MEKITRKVYSIADIDAMTKKEVQELAIAGAFNESGLAVISHALSKLATKSEPQKKVIVAVREYTRDVIDRATGVTKYAKGFVQELGEKNLRNVLTVQAKRIHKDPNLVASQVDVWVQEVLNGQTFEASNYVIKPIKA